MIDYIVCSANVCYYLRTNTSRTHEKTI